MKIIWLSALVITSLAISATHILGTELPSVPDEKSALTEVQLGGKHSAYEINLRWDGVNVGYVLDVTVSTLRGKSLYSVRLISFGDGYNEWSWGLDVPKEGKPFGTEEGTWLSLATNLMNRFVVSGDNGNIVADMLPWKHIGRVEKLQSYEVPYSFLFERNGRYKVIEPYEWLGDEPLVGKSVSLGEYHPAETPINDRRYFSATVTSGGRIAIEVGVAEAIANLKEKSLLAERE